jgi:hypothetical protein
VEGEVMWREGKRDLCIWQKRPNNTGMPERGEPMKGEMWRELGHGGMIYVIDMIYVI